MKRKLIILSHDAMVREDVLAEKDSPAFSYLLENGTWIETTQTIWPSITYPAHSTIISGQYPDKHGVYHNDHYYPDDPDPLWNWDAKYFHGESLFEAAKKAGLTTAGVFWPVSGNHPYVDWLISEYWPQTKDETFVHCQRMMGTSEEVIRDIIEPNLPDDPNFVRFHPIADQFVIDCACSMIRKYQPDLLVIHPADIDAHRHTNGVFSDKAREAVSRAAKWTQQIIAATRDAGTFADTVFVVMSDHGQVDLDRIMSPNVFFRQRGLLHVNEDGSFGEWTCYMRSTGVTAEIFVKGFDETTPEGRSEYAENLAKTRKALEEMKADPLFAIDRILTKEEAEAEFRLSGPFSFFLVGKGNVAYSNVLTGGLQMQFDTSAFQTAFATHGMDPDFGPQPTAIFCGPGVKRGLRIFRRPIVDIGPTCAKLLGIDLPHADGKAIDELIEPEDAETPYRIFGVTGRSGSGKSRFAKLLAEKLGCERIDIDAIGHDALKDPAVVEKIRRLYGDEVMQADGTVDRKALGKIVFGSAERMAEYTTVTWGYMQRVLSDILARTKGPVVFEWVLLPISGTFWNRANPKILVSASKEARKKAVLERDGISGEYFDQRDTQSLDFDRYAFDYVIENDYTPETLERAAEEISKAFSSKRG